MTAVDERGAVPGWSRIVRSMFRAKYPDPGFNVSFLDLFAHGVGDWTLSFDPAQALEVAEMNAALAGWEEPSGFGVPELPFFKAYGAFLAGNALAIPPKGWPAGQGERPAPFRVPLGPAGAELVAELTAAAPKLFEGTSAARACRLAALRKDCFQTEMDESMSAAAGFCSAGNFGRALACAFDVLALDPGNATAREFVEATRGSTFNLPRLNCSRWLPAVEEVDGWLSPGEANLLGQCVAAAPSDLSDEIWEIGSYKGRSTLAIALPIAELELPLRLTTIDPHTGYRFGDGSDTYGALLANLERHGLDRVRAVRGRSTEVPLSAPISFAFLDGLHDAASVRADYAHVAPFLVQNGLLSFHDYCEHFPDVLDLVGELMSTNRYELAGYVDRLIVLRRT